VLAVTREGRASPPPPSPLQPPFSHAPMYLAREGSALSALWILRVLSQNSPDSRIAVRVLLCVVELELELIQSHMAQKPVLRGEVGCTCVVRGFSIRASDFLIGRLGLPTA